jgi:hypothetical protein
MCVVTVLCFTTQLFLRAVLCTVPKESRMCVVQFSVSRRSSFTNSLRTEKDLGHSVWYHQLRCARDRGLPVQPVSGSVGGGLHHVFYAVWNSPLLLRKGSECPFPFLFSSSIVSSRFLSFSFFILEIRFACNTIDEWCRPQDDDDEVKVFGRVCLPLTDMVTTAGHGPADGSQGQHQCHQVSRGRPVL